MPQDTPNNTREEERIMRYGEDYWTPEEAENGLAPHNAAYDSASGVYRDVIEDDDEDEPPPLHSLLRSEHMVRALTAEQLGLTDEKDAE